jgi:hypothetical protein
VAGRGDGSREGGMARKRPRVVRKRRTREHIIADLSVHHVEGPILRVGFTLDRIVQDYGLDLRMMTYNAKGEAEPDYVLFQVKATDHLRLTADRSAVVFRAETADVVLWRKETFPMVLVIYDAQADVGYWLYVQAYFQDEEAAPKITGETVTLHIPTANVLGEAAVRRFAAAKAAISRQTKGVRHHV